MTSRRTRLLESLESRLLLSGTLPNESALGSWSNLWHLQNTGQNGGVAGADIGVTTAWDYTTGSKNVVVAVLDSGIDLNHPDLAANIWTNPGEIAGDGIDNEGDGYIDDVHGWNFLDNNNNVDDTSLTGHGTIVSGVLGAVGNNGIGISGVAWNVTILPVKIGQDGSVPSENVAAGINYVIKLKRMGLNVVAINASYLGFSGFGNAELNAISAAGANDILYVSAAGNGFFGSPVDLDGLGYSYIKRSNQLVVAATDRTDHLWSSSNYGGSSVELAAPGVDVTSTFNKLTGYWTDSGTSFAGPQVSGAIALLKSYAPTATGAQIRTAILQGVDKLPSLSGKVISGGRLNVAKAMQILINNLRFSGTVESATLTTIKGWAYDTELAAGAVPIKLVIDGVDQPTVPADIDRPDLAGRLPTTAHGFLIALPALGPGSHVIKVYATGDNNGERLLGTRTIVAKAPSGKAEVISGSLVKGYAWDPDSPADSIDVRIDVDGITFTTVTADASRPELKALTGSATHGFSVPLAALPLGFHRVDVYALDGQTQTPKLLASRTIIVNSAPQAVLESFSALGISGYAWDADAGTDPVQLRIDIDALPPMLITADQDRPDLAGPMEGTAHGFSFPVPNLTPGTHAVKVWVVDPESGKLTLLARKSFVYVNTPDNRMPLGRVEPVTATTLKGYTYDRDDPAASLDVRIDIDGVTGTPFASSEYRPLLKGQGGGNHGFSLDLTTLPAGPHRIDIYMHDSTSGTPILFYSKLVGISTAKGKATTFNRTTVEGWAFSPALGAGAAMVRIDVDTLPGIMFAADQAVPELLDTLGSTDHGFSVAMPTIAAGYHKIAVYVIDPLTYNATLLAARTYLFT